MLGDSLDSSCLCNNYLTLKSLFEHLHDPYLFNRVSFASTFILRVLLTLVAGGSEVVFGHFYPADPGAGEEWVVEAVMVSLSKAPLSFSFSRSRTP